MFNAETLISLGLANQVLSIWQVFIYLIIMISCLLLQRAKLCLLITYLFSYYLAFLIYWGDFIAKASSMVPFALYMFCGLAIVLLFVVGSLTQQKPIVSKDP